MKNLPISFPFQEFRATRDGYGEALVELGKKDSKVVVLAGDLTESTRSLEFSKQFPDRFIEMGVAEQNMAGVAAGLAAEGFVPFMSSYAEFSPGRNWEQIRVSICYSNLNVKIAGHHAGLMTGPDGATHQALEDIALMRVLPHMTVIVPADAVQAKQATMAAAQHRGPVYLRFTREKTPVFYRPEVEYRIGKADVLKEGTDVTIVACGHLVYRALEAALMMERGHVHARGTVSAEVINMHTIKPMDVETLVESVGKTGRVVTVEEHQINGGLGGAVAEILGVQHPVPMRMIGMRNSFGESGEAGELLKKYGMTTQDIVAAVGDVLETTSFAS